MINPDELMRLIEPLQGKREINTLDQVVSTKGLHLRSKPQLKNVYYIDGVNPDKEGRASDRDIIAKRAIVFDLDVRKLAPHAKDAEIKNQFLADVLSRLAKSGTLKNVNAIVFTGNGIHLYYVASKDYLCSGKESIWSLNYSKLAKQLDDILGKEGIVDIACRNLGRVFRLPGTWNNKVFVKKEDKWVVEYTDNEDEWKAVEVIYYQSELLNDDLLDEMFKEPKIESIEELTGARDSDSWYTEIITPEMTKVQVIKKLNMKKCLERISGIPEIYGEKYKLIERPGGGYTIEVDAGDGKFKSCNAWVDVRGRIGSGSNGGPYLWNWLMFFGRTEQQADEIIQKYFGHLLPKLDCNFIQNDELEIENWTNLEFRTKKSYFTWGLGDGSDDLLPLLGGGQLVVLAGDAGVGKTTLANKIAEDNAKRGYKVGFFSIEMPPKSVIMRQVRKALGITKLDRLSGQFNEDILTRSKELLAEIFSLGIYWPIFTNKIPTVELLTELISNRRELDVVIIDNLSFITSEKEAEYDKQGDVVQKLLEVAQSTNTCIILLHHFRKTSGKGDKGERYASDLKGNNDIFNKADVVVALTRQLQEADMGKSTNPMDERKDVRVLNYLSVFKDREDGELTKMQITYDKGRFKKSGY